MAKIHISKAGRPVNCPAKIACRLAPEIGHFDKVEQAQEFADQLNELRVQNRSHLGINSKQVSEMSNAELVYISEKIKSEAEQNENYKDYKGSVKWQKEVRSKASREMQAILEQNNTMSKQIGEQIDKVDNLRSKWKKEKDPGQKRAYFNALKIERDSLNTLRDSYGPIMVSNLDKFKNLRDKKEIAEQKILDGMKKQALHSETKSILADVETEIENRGEFQKAKNSLSNPQRLSAQILSNHEVTYPKIGDVTSEEDVKDLEKTYDEKLSQLNHTEQAVLKEEERLLEEISAYRQETQEIYSAIELPKENIERLQNESNYSEKEYNDYLNLKGKTLPGTTNGIEDAQLRSVIEKHVLIEKFGPNAGKPKNRDLTEKDLAWIDKYKQNPELMDSHLKLLNENRQANENARRLISKYSDYENKLELETYNHKEAQIKDRVTQLNNLNSALTENIRVKTDIQKSKADFTYAKSTVAERYKEYSNLTSANGGRPVSVKGTSVLKAHERGSEKLALDKDKLSSSNGEINNLYVRNDSGRPVNSSQIHKVKEVKNGSLILDNGEEIRPSKTLSRRRRGELSYNYSNLEVIYGEKSGSDYTGQTEINYHEYDSTD